MLDHLRIDGKDDEDNKISGLDIAGDAYYHGVSYLLFSQFSVPFYDPLSTSKQLEVVTLFTKNDGLIVELKEDNALLKFFNVGLISCFAFSLP